MSYILKRCRPAGGLQSFVQQCIFNRASHEQEPYGPKQEKKDRKKKRRTSVGGEWRGGEMMREGKRVKRVEKRGEREVQVRQAVIDWCFVFVVPQRSCRTAGHLVERRRFRLRLHSHWCYHTLFNILTCFTLFWEEGSGWKKDNVIVIGMISFLAVNISLESEKGYWHHKN